MKELFHHRLCVLVRKNMPRWMLLSLCVCDFVLGAVSGMQDSTLWWLEFGWGHCTGTRMPAGP